eukprot:gi/632967220/ref/XP_007899855.1/ PREDICTED: uncharacterized protein C11orf42 homolog [Callorhinchus milii]
MSLELKVLDSCQADEVWNLIRFQVASRLFPHSVVPVPHVQDAHQYDLLHVLIKQSELLRSRLMPAGLLENLLEPVPDSSINLMQNMAHSRQTEQGRHELKYEQVVMDRGVKKTLKATITEITKDSAFFLVNLGDMHLSRQLPWLRSVNSIYIINQVYLASNLQLSSAYGNQMLIFNSDSRRPIGFTCKKFTISSKGLIMEERRIRKPLVKAKFIKNANISLPLPVPPPTHSHGGSLRPRLAKFRTALDDRQKDKTSVDLGAQLQEEK